MKYRRPEKNNNNNNNNNMCTVLILFDLWIKYFSQTSQIFSVEFINSLILLNGQWRCRQIAVQHSNFTSQTVVIDCSVLCALLNVMKMTFLIAVYLVGIFTTNSG